MSKIFYDHLIDLTKLEKLIKKNVKDPESREEIYHLIDEIVHHRVVGCVLDKLPKEWHREFLDQVHTKVHDESILKFLKERVSEDVEEFIRREIYLVGTEILSMFKDKPSGTSAEA